MSVQRADHHRWHFNVFLFTAALLSAFAFPLKSVRAACPGDTLPDSYLQALDEASKATQDKVSRELLAIVPFADTVNKRELCGDSIAWQYDPLYGDFPTRIRVAAFMDRKTYEDNYKAALEANAATYMLRKSLWVTVAPEMRNFFSRRIFKNAGQCPPSAERVGQVLGLNPYSNGEVFVEMWVEPRHLIRPSADPPVTDHEAEVAIRISDYNWVFPSDSNPFMHINDDNFYKDAQWKAAAVPYKEWFVNRAETIYKVSTDACSPYPWTRLGYTYDWGKPHRAKHRGLSEFILRVDPDVDGGVAVVQLIRAVDSKDSKEWAAYFRCNRKCSD